MKFERIREMGSGRFAGVLVAAFALLIFAQSAYGYVLIEPFNAWGKPDMPVEWRLNTFWNDNTIANEFDILRQSFIPWTTLANTDISVVEGPVIGTQQPCGLQQNSISHVSMEDCFGQCTGGCLAVTSTVFFPFGDGFWNTNTVSDSLLIARQESDVTFSANINWEDYRDWPPCLGFDLWGVATHEYGHFFGIGHSNSGAATMFFAIGSCDSTKASLNNDDKRAQRVLYRDGTEIAVTTLSAGNASLAVTNKGNLGYTGAGGKWGDSFQFGPTGANEHIFECSFAVAEVGGAVSDNFREETAADPGGDADFQQSSELTTSVPGPITDQQAFASFDDSRAEAPYGVDVESRFYAQDNAPDNDFVIAEYLITNNSGGQLTDFRASLFSDVDFNNDFANNSVSYEADISLAVVSTANTGNLFGIAVLNSEGAAAMRALFATNGDPAEVYTDANKETWMSAGFERTTLGPADIALMIATGDFDIAVGETACAAFAVIGGTNISDLRANAIAAQDLYQNTIKDGPSSVEDGRVILPLASFDPVRPNPFSGSANLQYTLLTPGRVQLEIVDASGRLVTTLLDKEQAKGMHSVVWDGTDSGGRRAASGVYFSRLKTASGAVQKKMLMLK